MDNRKSGRELVDYVRKLATIPDNQEHADLRGRVVAALGVTDTQLPMAILEAGAERCYAVGLHAPAATHARMVPLQIEALGHGIPSVDVAFFDARYQTGFDHVNGIMALVAQMKRILKPGGVMFCVLKSGAANHAFDVYNSIVRSRTDFLPSQQYLFRDLLRDCSIRMLDWIPSPDNYETVRFFRLSIKLPSLLLIVGRSQSGKTSLARDLQTLDAQMHVSNDYIYCEMTDHIRKGAGGDIPQSLSGQLGDGSGQACFKFNRALEREPELLRAYLGWLVKALPRDKRVISMDFDLVDEAQIELAKAVLSEAGFSVWIVRR